MSSNNGFGMIAAGGVVRELGKRKHLDAATCLSLRFFLESVLPRKAGTNIKGCGPTCMPSHPQRNPRTSMLTLRQSNKITEWSTCGTLLNWLATLLIHYLCSRIIVTSIAGCVAGLLGQTGLMGFVWYLVSSVLVSLLLFFKLKGFQTKPYFTSWTTIWTEGFGQGLMVSVSSPFLIFTDHFLFTTSLSCYFGRILSFIRFAVWFFFFYDSITLPQPLLWILKLLLKGGMSVVPTAERQPAWINYFCWSIVAFWPSPPHT